MAGTGSWLDGAARTATAHWTDPGRCAGCRAGGEARMVVEQIYITHCTQSDSFRNQAGFSIRASSTRDAELLKFAFDYPSYELPIDMWGTHPRPEQAPRRLALIAAPGNRVALIHTSYVMQDTRGRPGSYFTHLVIYKQLTLGQALQTWGSPEWQTDYPQGAPKELEPFAGRLDQGLINDEVLQAFLTDDETAPADQDLATLVYPERLRGDAPRRRDLLRLALVG